MMASQPNEFRVGRIPFLVCAPYFHSTLAQKPQGIAYIDGPPSQQNAALQAGEILLSPSSSFTYAENPDLFAILPEICTGSTLEIQSVKLFSHVPIHQLQAKHVALTPQSSTSVQLLTLLLEKMHGIKPFWCTMQEPLRVAELKIGDQALWEAHLGTWKYEYDLASLWQEWTGLPFVFGMWIVHRKALSHPMLQTYRQMVMQSIQSFRENPSKALQHWFEHYPNPLQETDLTRYFQSIEYQFTDAHKEGLRVFYQFSQEHGLIQRVPELRFLN